MSTQTPAVAGTPRLILRLEGAALLIASVYLYSKTGMAWWLFVVLVLAPDLSLAAYIFGGPRIGGIVYNAAHSLIGPLALGLGGFLLPSFDLIALALIWLAHIGGDRMLGYGLKYDEGFAFTHLGRVTWPSV
jgi:hypothetical protein